jgi:Ca2+-binding RTX toxin-like protein
MSTAPEGLDRTTTQPLGITYFFSTVDFQFSDLDGDAGREVIITSLSTSGPFTYDGQAVVAGTRVDYDNLEGLVWETPVGVIGPGMLEFMFLIVDAGDEGANTDLQERTFRFNVVSAPQGADTSISVAANEVYHFSAEDFGFWDLEDDRFKGIQIDELPTTGSLVFDGAPAELVFVSVENLHRLAWIAPPTAGGSAEFKFRVVDETDTSGGNHDVDPVANSIFFTVEAPNEPPAGSDKTITIDEDSPYTFSLADFGFSDTDGDDAFGVKIVAKTANGTLNLDGVAIDDGDIVSVADLSKLVWKPEKDAYGDSLATLLFQVIDDGGTAGGGSNIDPSPNTLTFDVTSVLETYIGTSDPDTMDGTPEDDTFFGREGNDTIDGKGGADTMHGETGNDTYLVDELADSTIELAGQGTDTVKAAMTWTLAANIERLTLMNSGAFAGTGNGLANILTGNSGANRLKGLAGNDQIKAGAGVDTIHGGAGQDRLWGAAGRDFFVFDVKPSAANRDMIMDFNAAQDTIRLENSLFKKVGRPGVLNREAFALTTETREADDRIIYNRASGALLYDADGSGRQAAIQFATLANKPVLTFHDFVVI